MSKNIKKIVQTAALIMIMALSIGSAEAIIAFGLSNGRRLNLDGNNTFDIDFEITDTKAINDHQTELTFKVKDLQDKGDVLNLAWDLIRSDSSIDRITDFSDVAGVDKSVQAIYSEKELNDGVLITVEVYRGTGPDAAEHKVKRIRKNAAGEITIVDSSRSELLSNDIRSINTSYRTVPDTQQFSSTGFNTFRINPGKNTLDLDITVKSYTHHGDNINYAPEFVRIEVENQRGVVIINKTFTNDNPTFGAMPFVNVQDFNFKVKLEGLRSLDSYNFKLITNEKFPVTFHSPLLFETRIEAVQSFISPESTESDSENEADNSTGNGSENNDETDNNGDTDADEVNDGEVCGQGFTPGSGTINTCGDPDNSADDETTNDGSEDTGSTGGGSGNTESTTGSGSGDTGNTGGGSGSTGSTNGGSNDTGSTDNDTGTDDDEIETRDEDRFGDETETNIPNNDDQEISETTVVIPNRNNPNTGEITLVISEGENRSLKAGEELTYQIKVNSKIFKFDKYKKKGTAIVGNDGLLKLETLSFKEKRNKQRVAKLLKSQGKLKLLKITIREKEKSRVSVKRGERPKKINKVISKETIILD